VHSTQMTQNSTVARSTSGQKVCPLCGYDRILHFLNATDRFHLRPELYTLLRCSACSCVWLADPPSPEEMPYHYSQDYHEVITSAAEHKEGKRWEKHRAIVARYKEQGAILDIGCSSGSFLASMDNGRWKKYGIEMDDATAERARLSSGAEVFVGDVMNAPFLPESFDVITAFDVVEHMYRPRMVLERALRWLRPGGIFFARVPNIDSWEAKLFKTYWYGLELPRHLYHFSVTSMKYLMTELGVSEWSVTATGLGNHVEPSVGYLYQQVLARFGFSPLSMAKRRRANLPWRVVRKALRMGLTFPASRVASAANAGVVIEVVFRKQN